MRNETLVNSSCKKARSFMRGAPLIAILIMIMAVPASAKSSAAPSKNFEPITVTFESVLGRAELVVDCTVATCAEADGGRSWNLDRPMVLRDGASGDELARVQTARGIQAADTIVLNFVVSSAGGGNFTITSAESNPDPIGQARGIASAAVTESGIQGGLPGLTGEQSGGGSYRAYYNASETDFAVLAPGVSSPKPYTSMTSADRFPASGFSTSDQSGATLGTVDRMQSQWKFSVASGSASGTSVFRIEGDPPAPAAASAEPALTAPADSYVIEPTPILRRGASPSSIPKWF